MGNITRCSCGNSKKQNKYGIVLYIFPDTSSFIWVMKILMFMFLNNEKSLVNNISISQHNHVEWWGSRLAGKGSQPNLFLLTYNYYFLFSFPRFLLFLNILQKAIYYFVGNMKLLNIMLLPYAICFHWPGHT